VPLYEYQCPKCGRFELIRKFSDEPVTKCPTCGRPVQKLASAPAFHLKGTGWYATDYPKKSSSGEGKSGGGSSGEGKSGDGKSGEGKSSESKSAGKSDSGSGSGESGSKSSGGETSGGSKDKSTPPSKSKKSG
jgi:putative FmdB family regulatory protein